MTVPVSASCFVESCFRTRSQVGARSGSYAQCLEVVYPVLQLEVEVHVDEQVQAHVFEAVVGEHRDCQKSEGKAVENCDNDSRQHVDRDWGRNRLD